MRGEDRLTAWLRRQPGARLVGDDAAFLRLPRDVAVTVDAQIEGVHFLSGRSPADVARRLLAVNLSDLAACGARPAYAFLALAAPPGYPHRRFLGALLRAAAPYGVRLAGGDLAASPRLAATLTLLGTRPAGSRWVRRDTARAGDRLWLGGTVGEAALGLRVQAAGGAPTSPAERRALTRLRRPAPQLALGAWLGRRSRAAAIDVSDGLARDLHRLCRASGVGAELDATALPVPRDFAAACARVGADPRALALGGGDDYVLLFALPARLEPPEPFGARAVGTITAGRRVLLRDGSRVRQLADRGFDHLARRPTLSA